VYLWGVVDHCAIAILPRHHNFQQAFGRVIGEIQTSAQEIEAKLRGPPKPAAPAAPARKGAPAAPAAAAVVGDGVEVPVADPMRLIKHADVPLLSRDKKKSEDSTLEFLVQVRPSGCFTDHNHHHQHPVQFTADGAGKSYMSSTFEFQWLGRSAC
jgi:hypothetical protein